MGKMDEIGRKRGKQRRKISEKSPKNEEKAQKIPNLKNAQDLIIAQGGFFSPKTIRAH